MNALMVLADDATTGAAFDIGALVTEMSNSVLASISTTMVSLTPVITTVTVIGFAIKLFKKYVK